MLEGRDIKATVEVEIKTNFPVRGRKLFSSFLIDVNITLQIKTNFPVRGRKRLRISLC